MNKVNISELRCSSSENTIISGKIKSKSMLNKFRKGNGCLFSIDMDDDSAKIRMVFFNDLAQKHFQSIEVS